MTTPSPTANPADHWKSDAEVKTEIQSEIHREPSVHETDIGILVKDGVVTLNGRTETYAEKWHALSAAKRVVGVKAIADQIEIVAGLETRLTDTDVAAAAVHKIAWSTTIPVGAITLTVREGLITLEGEVDWMYQRDAAENVIAYLRGVKGVKNLITLRPAPPPQDLPSRIRSDLDRNAMLDASQISIVEHGDKVTLAGTVASDAERDEAERTAWAAPGVLSVENRIKIDWNWRDLV